MNKVDWCSRHNSRSHSPQPIELININRSVRYVFGFNSPYVKLNLSCLIKVLLLLLLFLTEQNLALPDDADIRAQINLSAELADLHLKDMALEDHFLELLVGHSREHLELVTGVLHCDCGSVAGSGLGGQVSLEGGDF